MKVNFTTTIPDYPYGQSTTNNKTVNATYIGKRYLVIAVNGTTNLVEYVAAASDDIAQCNLGNFRADVPLYFTLLDAKNNPWEAAYLTGEYTTDPIPEYVETLPNGEEYRYEYSQENIISEVHDGINCNTANGWGLRFANNAYTKPTFRTHMLTRENFLEGIEQQKTMITETLNDPDWEGTDEDRTVFQNYLTWLNSVPTVYANVDHWKIPWFAEELPSF